MPRAGKRCGSQLNVLISFSGSVGFLEDAVSLPVEAFTAAALSFAGAFNQCIQSRRSELAK